ncbi:hypothetical protein RFI_16776 [Reticulomyxa filosa]|uniref:PUA domain-containing protein n=1 Tax=Reticulomyxa filosa TaxID=46433 RepID=X6N310_RETFI|nr:hypothetical protein RFI_16776 [Reticulomyxa filosa]|eukprot:ETO20441.1 hypothetical protein RFI_16776 [Reticulomyxa filosa]
MFKKQLLRLFAGKFAQDKKKVILMDGNRFSRESVSANNRAKTSVIRTIKKEILDCYPSLTEYMEEVFPKKGVMNTATAKTAGTKVTFIMDEDMNILFFQIREEKPIPTLRTLHKFPNLLPKFQVDKGAIPFVLKGSDIFCRGLTSKGGKMDEVTKDTVVAIYAEGRVHACAIGTTLMDTKTIREVNDGIAVTQYNYLGDGLWKLPHLR